MTEVRNQAFYYGLKPEEYNESLFFDVIDFINQQMKREAKESRLSWEIARTMTCHLLNVSGKSYESKIIPEMIVRFEDEDDPETISEKKMAEILEEYNKIDFSGADEALRKAGLI